MKLNKYHYQALHEVYISGGREALDLGIEGKSALLDLLDLGLVETVGLARYQPTAKVRVSAEHVKRPLADEALKSVLSFLPRSAHDLATVTGIPVSMVTSLLDTLRLDGEVEYAPGLDEWRKKTAPAVVALSADAARLLQCLRYFSAPKETFESLLGEGAVKNGCSELISLGLISGTAREYKLDPRGNVDINASIAQAAAHKIVPPNLGGNYGRILRALPSTGQAASLPGTDLSVAAARLVRRRLIEEVDGGKYRLTRFAQDACDLSSALRAEADELEISLNEALVLDVFRVLAHWDSRSTIQSYAGLLEYEFAPALASLMRRGWVVEKPGHIIAGKPPIGISDSESIPWHRVDAALLSSSRVVRYFNEPSSIVLRFIMTHYSKCCQVNDLVRAGKLSEEKAKSVTMDLIHRSILGINSYGTLRITSWANHCVDIRLSAPPLEESAPKNGPAPPPIASGAEDCSLDTYQSGALAYDKFQPTSQAESYYVQQLPGKTGRICDEWTRLIAAHREPTKADKDAIEGALADQLWLLATLASKMGLKLSEVAKRSLERKRLGF